MMADAISWVGRRGRRTSLAWSKGPKRLREYGVAVAAAIVAAHADGTATPS
jgi:hypothetical protein